VQRRATGRISRPDAIAAELAGDSVAVNGVCLTVTATTGARFEATVSPETLRVTTAGAETGSRVNLERPVRHDGRLGGHFVLGHVDGVGRVTSIEPDGECYWLDVEIPVELAPFLIHKGSIAIDGISLTVASVEQSHVRIQIVPFTWAHTSLSTLRPGAPGNIETDVIGKYVARLLGERRPL
jgi:riboflavin synthase